VVAEDINRQLRRRMAGYGRGARMKLEADEVEILSGVRAGETLGSPITFLIRNRDWVNWEEIMCAEPDPPGHQERRRQVRRPRPGHADLAGVLKYDRRDARDILERASARETAARVACGAACRKLAAEFEVEIGSHVVELGSVRAHVPEPLPAPLNELADESPVRCLDPTASDKMVAEIDAADQARDTLGGAAEIVVRGLVVGLGSHVSWDRKLDGQIARAIMSIPGVKGVEIGLGFAAAGRRGSQVHDGIVSGGGDRSGRFGRTTNRAGGLEGGITTGEPLVIRAAMKPIATVRKPLPSIDLVTGEPAKAQVERSDVTAVPAMGVIAEAMAAIVVARAMREKFGGDSLPEMRDNYVSYLRRLEQRRT
ncbi:MAG: chorismate synthase, partial [Gemmatimonas sp. SG8_17]